MTQPQPAPITHQPYYTRRRQDWEIGNERQRHQQALYLAGEPTLFVLLWKVEDFEAGYVQRCARCFSDPNSVNGRLAAVYEQPITFTCPQCYGTTFQGGVRARIIRPAIFTDTDEDERKSPRGAVHPESLTVETTNDFRSRTGDYVFRKNGSRWQLGTPRRIMVRTGYEHPNQTDTSIGYAQIPASREDEASVAYLIDPSPSDLSTQLAASTSIAPAAYPTPYDQVNGPLIPFRERE